MSEVKCVGIGYMAVSSLLWMGVGSSLEKGEAGVSVLFTIIAVIFSALAVYCFVSKDRSMENKSGGN